MAKKPAVKQKVKRVPWKELGKSFLEPLKEKSYEEIAEIIEKKVGVRPSSSGVADAFANQGIKRKWMKRTSNPVWTDEMKDEIIYAYGVKSQQFAKGDRENLANVKAELLAAIKEKNPGVTWKKIGLIASGMSQDDIAKRAIVNPKLKDIKAPLRWGKPRQNAAISVELSPESKILKRLQKGHWDIPGIAKEFETSEEEAVRLIDSLYKKGHDVIHERETKQVYLSSDLTKFDAFHFDPRSNAKREILRHTRKIGVIHGTVLGSKYSNPTLLHTIYSKFEDAGVDMAIHLGDVITGRLIGKREGESFLRADLNSQINYALAHYPRSKTFKTYMISGTRDLTFKSRKGAVLNAVRSICSSDDRPDLVYRGDLYAVFQVLGVRIEAINPGEDYAPYAKSYALQNILTNIISEEESLMPRTQDEAVIAIVGGSHVYDRIKYGGIHGVLVPSLQSLTPYQKGKRKRGFAPVIGACIIELQFDDNWELKKDKSRDGIKVRLLKLKKYQKRDDYRAGVVVKSGLAEVEQKALKLLDERPRTEGDISRVLKIHKDKVWQIVDKLQSSGYQILTPRDAEQVDSKQFILQYRLATQFKSLALKDIFATKKKAAFVSDTHYGSLDQLCSCVNMFYEVCDEEKVDAIYHCGDWTAGDFDHPANRQKVYIPGSQGQVEFLADWWPKSKRGVKIVGIGGNHDDQHGGRKGIDVLETIFAKNRSDVKYLGSTVGVDKLDKLNVELLHPAGGAGYALSYKSQNITESEIRRNRALGVKLHVLALGNWHIYNEQVHSEVIVITVPCFQQQTKDYMLPKGLDPWIGGLICEFVCDKEDYITEFATEFVDMAKMANVPDFPEMPIKEFFKKYFKTDVFFTKKL